MLTTYFYEKKIFSKQKKLGGRVALFYILKISLMSGITEAAEFSYLRLHSICYNMFYWSKYMRKIGLHRDMYLEKTSQTPWKNLGDSQGSQTSLREAQLLRIFWCVYRQSNCSRYNGIHWFFKSLSGFPEGGSPTVDGPLPSFSSNSNLSEQVWNELVISKLQGKGMTSYKRDFGVKLGNRFYFK